MENTEQYRIKGVPDLAYYIPNFVSEAEEKMLLKEIYSVPKPKWKQLSNRRLQNWGGLPHPKGMLVETVPQWLQTWVDKVSALNVFDGKIPNHVLINEYLAGQGIMPHTDGPLFYPTISTINLGSHTVLNFYKPILQSGESVAATENEVNIHSSEETFNVDPQSGASFSLLLLPRSCLILKGSLYHDYHHGIDEKVSDVLDSTKLVNLDNCDISFCADNLLKRNSRVSLTIRHVPKTFKMTFGKKN
ncbi:Alpha-ketoglutarate-dependent dioxygenase alkB 6 [Chamberlinius hualienensis]